jgi:hypothetical protein
MINYIELHEVPPHLSHLSAGGDGVMNINEIQLWRLSPEGTLSNVAVHGTATLLQGHADRWFSSLASVSAPGQTGPIYNQQAVQSINNGIPLKPHPNGGYFGFQFTTIPIGETTWNANTYPTPALYPIIRITLEEPCPLSEILSLVIFNRNDPDECTGRLGQDLVILRDINQHIVSQVQLPDYNSTSTTDPLYVRVDYQQDTTFTQYTTALISEAATKIISVDSSDMQITTDHFTDTNQLYDFHSNLYGEQPNISTNPIPKIKITLDRDYNINNIISAVIYNRLNQAQVRLSKDTLILKSSNGTILSSFQFPQIQSTQIRVDYINNINDNYMTNDESTTLIVNKNSPTTIIFKNIIVQDTNNNNYEFTSSSSSPQGLFFSQYNLINYSKYKYTGLNNVNNYFGHYLQVEFKIKSKIITCFEIQSTSNFNQAPGNFKIFGSINGIVWIELNNEEYIVDKLFNPYFNKKYFNNSNQTSINTPKLFTINKPGNYYFYRLVINQNMGHNGILSIQNFKLYSDTKIGKTITYFEIYPTIDSITTSPGAFKIFGSNNQNNWIDLNDEYIVTDTYTNNIPKLFKIDQYDNYIYYRLVINQNMGHNNYLSISQLKLYSDINIAKKLHILKYILLFIIIHNYQDHLKYLVVMDLIGYN